MMLKYDLTSLAIDQALTEIRTKGHLATETFIIKVKCPWNKVK